jgi:hypothetical protein
MFTGLTHSIRELVEDRMKAPNNHNARETWLRAAANELRPYFASCGYTIPEQIRFAIAFPSTGRKGKRVGECWHSTTSDDAHFEIFIRADLADPIHILGVLTKELVHTCLPPNSGHGKLFKEAATKIGLQGPMRQAMPGVLLQSRLIDLAATLGPLPHARLNIEQGPSLAVPIDRPKKQRARLLKAECSGDGCGYTVRVTSKWVRDLGPPHCPRHGPMTVDLLPETEAEPDAPETV